MDSQAKYNIRDISSKRYQERAHNSTATTPPAHSLITNADYTSTQASNPFHAHEIVSTYVFSQTFIFVLYTTPNTIYNTGEWPQDFTEVTTIALKKKTKATKCSDYRTISLIEHTAKKIAKILRRRIEKKIEDVLGEDQFGIRRGKANRDAIGMMRIIAEQTLEIDEKIVCLLHRLAEVI